jgi:digeranylgeranylglycerophospholipid reductase
LFLIRVKGYYQTGKGFTPELSSTYDVVVGGGSVGGLSFASRAASQGLRVLVLEEDPEIGEPEKCDGLVSLKAMSDYIAPERDCIQSRVRSGTVFAPSGVSATLDASRLEVIVIDRSAYDRQLAELAKSRGAKVVTSSRVLGTEATQDGVKVRAGAEEYRCSYYVDATGPSGVIRRNRRGLIPAAKYEVRGDWFRDGEVEVHLDQRKYPGFFAWVIPRGDGIAKVGAAGFGINSFRALESFLAKKGGEVLKKVAAPIYVGGAVSEFVSGRTILVGESAGQVKPTTAGGILASVAGGTMAADSVAKAMARGDRRQLGAYQRNWERRFGSEFRTMKRLRGVFEGLSNGDLERIVSLLSSKRVSERLATADFDFHATALLSAVGAKGTIQLAKLLISSEARQALTSLVR